MPDVRPISRRPRLLVTVALQASALLACGPSYGSLGAHVGDSDSAGDGTDAATDPGSTESGSEGDSGALDCRELAEKLGLMPDFDSGWAVEGHRLLVQVGAREFACAADLRDEFYDMPSCPPLWAFEIQVPVDVLDAGTHTLSPDDEGNLVYVERGAGGDGCSRQWIKSAARGFEGQLTVHLVTEGCIVGELVGLEFPSGDVPDLSGAFAAQRCMDP